MKLYTEEQVRNMMEDSFNFGDRAIDYALSKMTSIELPINVEIVDQLNNIGDDEHKLGFSRGICWAIDYINQQSVTDDTLSKQKDNENRN